MTTIYFAGQDNFGNRGCEALIRANVKTIRHYLPNAHFIVPSHSPALDAAQWLDASNLEVRFIPAEPFPSVIQWWSRAKRVFKSLINKPPKFSITPSTRQAILNADMFVMTGGDIITLDYGLESLYFWMRLCELAMEAGKPTVLWGASVGPFKKIPATEQVMIPFLKRFDLITVRETASLEYLISLGIENVELVTDSAFVLDVEPIPSNSISILQGTKPILGFNVSPVIRSFRETAESKEAMDKEVVDFLAQLLKQGEFAVLLIPHVDPLSGIGENSDSTYMGGLLSKLRHQGFTHEQIDMLPRNFNTAQLKAVIAKCAYFIGGRTHATIAALSQGVPTTSIAYSVKAKGINRDLFGHTKYVLETPSVTALTLKEHFDLLREDTIKIQKLLADRLPVWKEKAFESARIALQLKHFG